MAATPAKPAPATTPQHASGPASRPASPAPPLPRPGSEPVEITLSTPGGSYSIHVGPALFDSLGERLQSLTPGRSPRVFVITSPEIWRLWSEPLLASLVGSQKPTALLLPPGEAGKRLASVERLAQKLASSGADRDSLLLALGGGIIGDITGFLAAIYMRGIAYAQLPTTLLAQVDSAVGGKTGVNLRAGKNLVGAFHHPLAVFANTDTLSTLPDRELRAGLQESIKAGVIRSPGLFRFLEQNSAAVLGRSDPQHLAALKHVVVESVRIKAEIVSADEREAGLRMILNFGHTLGHAIEAATRYTQLLHGEAVAWGSIAAVHLSRVRGTLSRNDADRIEQTILRYGPLPHFKATTARLVHLTASDKKTRSGVRSFVLPTAIGQVEIVRDVTDTDLHRAAASMLSLMQQQPDSQ